jgi:hypothetical protein
MRKAKEAEECPFSSEVRQLSSYQSKNWEYITKAKVRN